MRLDVPVRTRPGLVGDGPGGDLLGGAGGKDAEMLADLRTRLQTGSEYWREVYENSRDDVAFVYGDQWEDETLAERTMHGRPALTLNTLGQYIHLVAGQSRQTRYAVKVRQTSGLNQRMRPVDGKPGGRELSAAEVVGGGIRDIENRSNARRVYARALQHAAEGGFGWLRLRTQRTEDDPFNIECRIEGVRDRWSVIIDPNCERFDCSDMDWAVEHRRMPESEFRARWPDLTVSDAWFGGDYPVGTGSHPGDRGWWYGEGMVRVCEYFYRTPSKRTALQLVAPQGRGFERPVVAWEDEIEPVLDDLIRQGYRVVDEQEMDARRVHVCVATMNHVLEAPQEWPDHEIPIVPVIGRQADMEGRHYWFGLTKFARDPQQMLNYWATSATERVGDATKSQWIATDEQVAGAHMEAWRDQNIRRDAVLLYTHAADVPPPRREAPAAMPVAETQLVGLARQLVSDTIGIHPASLGQPGNETSGKAIARRQQPGNTSLFELQDNLAMSIEAVGKRLCRIIPRIYSGPRLLQLSLEDETDALVNVNQQVVDEQTGREFTFASLSLARYTCTVTTGPQFDTQRQEFVELMTEWGKTDPEGFSAVRHLVMKAIDAPMKEELSRAFTAIAPPAVLSPEDQAKRPKPEPTPQDQIRQLEVQAAMAKAQADMQKAQQDPQSAAMKLEIEKLRMEMAGIKLQTEKLLAVKRVERDDMEKETASGGVDEAIIGRLLRPMVADMMAAQGPNPLTGNRGQ